MILSKIALEISILIGLSVALGVAQKDREAPGRLTFVLLACACMLWSLGELLALLEVVGDRAADRIRYAGILALPAFWVGFAAHIAGLEMARRVPWFSALLILPGACFYSLLYSSRLGSLFLAVLPDGATQHGPFWMTWTLYAQFLLLGGAALLIATAFRCAHRGQVGLRLTLCFGAVLPISGTLLERQVNGAGSVDPTPLVLSVALLALRSAAYTGGVLQRIPLAQRDLLHQLPFGVILTDRYGTVVEINDAGINRLRTTERKVIGRSLGSVMATTGVVPLRSAPLRRWGRAAGEIVLV